MRRGPTDWCRLGRWDVAAGTYEPGPWLRGTIYPERCDLSPDGRYFAYFALKASAQWALGPTYVAISRLPELTAIAAWGTDGTWTRGIHFVDDATVCDVDDPDHGALPRDLGCGVAVTRPPSFSVERRQGIGEVEPADVQWAGWSRDGRLLVATTAGELQTRDSSDWMRPTTVVADLSLERPT